MSTPLLRPPGFGWRESAPGVLELYAEQTRAAELAARFGTPLYCYSGRAITSRFRAFNRAFRGAPHTICYSVKANSNLAILRLLGTMGSGFDVVSGGELARVLRAWPGAARKVVFSGVGKTAGEIDAALRAGILLFNAESESEVERLAARAAGLKKRASIALRVNPDIPAETHPYIATGMREHKFGIAMSAAPAALALAASSRWLRVAGLSVHIGSQILESGAFAAALERVSCLARDLRSPLYRLRYLDAGGGLGIPYQDPETEVQFAERCRQYAEAVMRPLRNLKLRLLLEPGRAIIGPAGILITRVLYRKTNGRKSFLVVDAAMNDLLRPSLYGARHEIVPAVWRPGGASELFDVVGPICESGDFLARDRQLPEVAEGELLAILDAGAYGMSLASNYNTRPRAAEVLVSGSKPRLVRRRERVRDLYAQEFL
ncbi:MAG: diaminopimelate decarboxylase [Acidobacteria bacterium]|nr:diaminopimelate decarboxylase [Acidobacteriota bacterium]